MRGYKILYQSNNLKLIRDVKNKLSDTSLFETDQKISSFFIDVKNEKAEVIIRQFLTYYILNFEFNKILLSCIADSDSKIIYPLPIKWQEILVSLNFKVDKTYCSLLWFFFGCDMWLKGLKNILKNIYISFFEIITKSSKILNAYTYFDMDGFSENCLPKSMNEDKNYNIINWYINWKEKNNKINTLCHGIKSIKNFEISGFKIKYIKNPLLPLGNLNALFKYILWSTISLIFSIFDLIRIKTWHAIILKEASLAKIANLKSSNDLAKEYMFNNWWHRPLWTYEVERKGSRVIVYFYSANGETPKGVVKNDYQLKLAYWPEFLVWDSYHANFINKSLRNVKNTTIVGPIWFTDISNEIPVMPKNSAAVFDVQPHRDIKFCSLGSPIRYLVPETANKFLSDIIYVLKKLNIYIVHKRKRNIGKNIHPKYRAFMDNFSKKKNVININPGISAIKIIEKCKFTISMPFTSTALIALNKDKPSIYYDPIGIMHPNDHSAHGIEIINNRDKLLEWVSKIV